MSTTFAKMRTKYGENIGVELLFLFPELQDDALTYLDADSLAGATTLSSNGTDLSVGQYVVIGQSGNEKTEIVQVSQSVAPTSTVITLQTATAFAHNRGDIVRFIPYNQIAAEYATDGSTFNTISAVAIRADATETYMQRTADLSTYSYRFRFYNSYSGLYSAYSDTVTGAGYGDNTVWAVKNRALTQLGEVRGDLIKDQFLNDSIMEARRLADQNPSVFRWSFRTKFGAVIGQMLAGQWSIAVPTDLRDQNTYKNILSLRFGAQNRPIIYQDRNRFNQNYLNVGHSTVATQQTAGQTTLVLSSTHDLDASGSITVANNAYGDGLVTISYTANNKTTNTLSGIPASGTGSIGRTILVGTDIWQRATVGTSSVPSAYTIDKGVLYFDVLVGTQYDGQDLKGDYYSAIPVINSDADTFDEPFYDLYVPYLKYKIKYLKANGKIDRDGDTDFKDWIAGLSSLIGQETPGQRVNFIPDIEGFLGNEG